MLEGHLLAASGDRNQSRREDCRGLVEAHLAVLRVAPAVHLAFHAADGYHVGVAAGNAADDREVRHLLGTVQAVLVAVAVHA